MPKIIFNHKILNKKELKFSVDNRAFLYGDGLFESVKIINGRPFNLEVHLKRLFSASTLLDLQISASKKDFRNKIELLIKENKIIKGGNLKIIVFREKGGKFLPENNSTSFLIMSEKSENNLFKLNKNGLALGLFRDQLKPKGGLSNYKTISALQSVMCSLDARKKAKEDCLMFNSENNIIESSNSNVFYVKNKVIYTPKLLEGCVDGTMRNYILNLRNLDFNIIETEVKTEDILNADEVFLSNAISGIKWVSSIEDSEFPQHNVSQLLIEKINQLV